LKLYMDNKYYYWAITGLIIFGILGYCTYSDSTVDKITQEEVETIRTSNDLPGLAVVVFSSDTVYNIIYSGYKKLGSKELLNESSQFHLGSNTKAFIGFAAASMVEDGLISWDTKFFDVCPEYRELASKDYYDITLEQLLHHQAGLKSKDDEFIEVMMPNMEGDSVIDRHTLLGWALSFDRFDAGYQYSNTGYVMAACMLEKQAGKGWKEILQERIFEPLSIEGFYGWPTLHDTNQTWGHYTDPESGNYIPHPPDDPYRLSSLSFGPAGDLNMTARRDTIEKIISSDTP